MLQLGVVCPRWVDARLLNLAKQPLPDFIVSRDTRSSIPTPHHSGLYAGLLLVV